MKFRHQLFFWILILLIMTLVFGRGNGNYIESFYFVCMLLPVAIGTSWFFNEVLVQRLLMKKHYLKFLVFFIYSLIISLWLQMLVLTLSLIILANYDANQMNPYTTNIQFLAFTIYLVVFMQAFIQIFLEMKRVKERVTELEETNKNSSSGYILIRSDRKNRKVDLDGILYIESLSDYVRFVLPSETVITREKISGLQDRLPSNFVRIHRSFLANRDKITSFNKEEINIGDQQLPVSRKYKGSFLQAMNPRMEESSSQSG